MDSTSFDLSTPEFAAAFLQAAVTLGLAILFFFLWQRYRKLHFICWAVAWLIYSLRLASIVTFLLTSGFAWLYWHQVATGWTALAFLWAALVFSQQVSWRWKYLVFLAYPPIWSYLAIYQLDNFLLAAGPAVLFLSGATLWTGWTFARYRRRVGSTAAGFLALTLFLWGLHHLDYPFLRARGAWTPWGYYLDIIFALSMGTGILLLVLEDLGRGLRTLSALSGHLQLRTWDDDAVQALLERPQSLPGVRGAALFLVRNGDRQFAGGSGVCASWTATWPPDVSERLVGEALRDGKPVVRHDLANSFAYAAALPVFRGDAVGGVLIMVGDERDPFGALDARFLITVGQQVGAAIENANLYRRLEGRTRELERMATRMVQQHEAERTRLSRELHDETAQVFSAVRMQLGVAREMADRDSVPRLDRALQLVDAGLQSIRQVARDLRPSLLDDLGLMPALRALVDDFSEHSGLEATITGPAELSEVPEQVELVIFRTIQEALANVMRHAEAATVHVDLICDAQGVRLRVEDDGCGLPRDFDMTALEARGHMGLAGMRERVARLNGTVGVTAGPDGGTRVDITIPIGPPEE